MTDQLLDLRSGCLEQPTRLDLDFIGAWVLWPTDQSMRERAIETSAVAQFRAFASVLGNDDYVPLIALALHAGFDPIALAADAMPLADMQERTRDSFVRGTRAGKYLQETVGRAALTKAKASMKRIAEQVSGGFEPYASSINPHTFENHVWPVYRRVAHFWAAWLDVKQLAAGSNAFPCAGAHLITFLARAEGYRHVGERTETRRGTTVLLPSETIKLPAWFTHCDEPEFRRKAAVHN